MSCDIVEYVQKQENLEKVSEGKTKQIYLVKSHANVVLVRSKNQLTAFNAVRKDELEGKGAIANKTTTHVFQYLQNLGLQTSFIRGISETEFLAKRCEMVPIEWVARRVATGSFLKRNPGVKEGFRFADPKIETFFKDDANDDPQWSDEQMLSAEFTFNGLKIGKPEIALMRKMTSIIFKLLEKGWAQNDCSLIDMKVEYGVTMDGELVLSDVIDNDSWRVWPAGDRRLQLDKQFYRDMPEVTQDALKQLIKNYEKVMNLTDKFSAEPKSRVLIIMGSGSDVKHCEKIADCCRKFGLIPVLRVNSAHKATRDTLDVVAEFESDGIPTAVVAVAGRSNGLGPVIAGNSTLPVINCPPVGPDWAAQDIWSSLRTPSGLGCSTVLSPDEAALCAAKTLATTDHMVWGKVLVEQLNNYITIYKSDKKINIQ